MKNKSLFAITFLLFVMLSPFVWADTHTATSCKQEDVQAAINLASPGDTVEVPAGTATWTPIIDCETAVGNVKCMLLTTKGIILKGGIGGATTITLSGAAPRGAIKFSPDAASLARNDPFEFTGFTINSNKQAYAEGSLTIYPYPSMAGIMDKIKIHDNIFKNSLSSAISVNGPIYGVAYSNTFISCGGYMNRWMGGDADSWDRVPREYGTNTQFFFEDNVISFEAGTPSGKDAFMTGQGAPGLVMRYNTFDLANTTGGELGDIHGLQSMTTAAGFTCPHGCGYSDCTPTPVGSCDPAVRSCQQWSTIKVELYGNIWTNLPSSGLYLWIVHRGSWLLMFNNTLSGTGAGNTPQYSQYSCDSCISKPGYPSMHIQNTYIWNNTANGTRKDLTKRLDYCSDCAIGSPYTVAENVDYWNYNPNTLNGSTQKGINCGSAAPTSPCFVGDGYWQTSYSPCSSPPGTMADMKTYTQAGTFYKCTSPNKWEIYYKPFTYPHPLRGENTPQTFSLAAGWNWISFNVLPADLSLNAVFSGILIQVDQVKTQTQSAIRSGNVWKGDLADMSDIGQYKMYKVKVTEACTLTVTGTAIFPIFPISLQAGWNWVAYLPTSAMSITTALASISGQVLEVKSRTASATYSGGAWSGTLSQLEPGQGYAIKMSGPGTLIYPAAAGANHENKQ
jgi:hypothetical protein